MARLAGLDSDVLLELRTGETVVGRGPLLKIVDKRVSRSHAALEWENGILRLCPKHSNPCFLRNSGRSEFTPLARDKWVELHHGDQISLLPDSLRYRVELETSEGGEPGTSSQQRSQGEGEKVDGPTAEEKWKRETAPAASTGRRRVLPPWLCGLTSTISPPQATPSRARAPGKAQVKRTRPPSPSPDNDRQHPRPETGALDPQPVAASPDQPLPPCPYGATCYRKNPSHFLEFSHSSVEDERPQCPYGSACYRINSDHCKQFRHSGPPAAPPARKRARQTRPNKTVSALAGDSDDSETPNTYDYTDSFIDDKELSSGSTSYGGESGDSDWAPPTATGGEGEGDGEGEEEAGELVDEANSFISNKKMWQP